VLGDPRLYPEERVPQVVVGLSGGVDSSLTAAVAVDALAPMPCTASRCRQRSPRRRAGRCRGPGPELGIDFRTIPIGDIYDAYIRTLALTSRAETGETEENLRRARAATS